MENEFVLNKIRYTNITNSPSEKVSLCNPECNFWSYRNPIASASWVLGFKECVTTSGLETPILLREELQTISKW